MSIALLPSKSTIEGPSELRAKLATFSFSRTSF